MALIVLSRTFVRGSQIIRVYCGNAEQLRLHGVVPEMYVRDQKGKIVDAWFTTPPSKRA